MRTFITTSVVVGAAAGLLLTGCSSSSSSSSSSASPADSSPMASEPMSSGTPGSVLPPIEITGAGKKTVKVGDTLNIPVADVTKVKTNNATVLKVSQPSDDGTVQMSGGAEVLAAGNARLVVITKNGKFVVKVTATDS